jgi:hypothetical protein
VSFRRAALVAAFSLLSLVAAGPARAATDGACTDPAGVTVVVDATALGGDVSIGCADDSPATGTDALRQAGFADTRDASGLICALDSLPDPCPTTFAGEYWSYWHAEDGTWQAYMEGSDTAVPQPGGVEGWRWSDGSAGPEVDLAALTPAPETDAPQPGASEQASGTVTPTVTDPPSATETVAPAGQVEEQSTGGGSVPWFAIVVGLIALGLVVTTAVVMRRGRS